MAYAKVQIKEGESFSGTTVTVTPDAPFTAGNALIIGYAADPTSISLTSISDGVNIYTIGAQDTGTAISRKCGYAYAFNIAAGSPTITATFSGTIANTEIWVEEWSGIAGSGAFDGGSALGTGGSGASGQSFNSGSFTPTTTGDLIWAFAFCPQGNPCTPGSTFTAAFTSNADYASEFQTQSAAAAIAPDFKTSGINQFDLGAVAAAFKPFTFTGYVFSIGQSNMAQTTRMIGY